MHIVTNERVFFMQSGSNSDDFLSFVLSNTNFLPEHLRSRKHALSLALTSKDMLNTVSAQYNKQLGNTKVIAVAAGGTHSLLLTDNGQVFSFGDGNNGKLGHGNEKSYFTPTEIPSLTNIVQIAAGSHHSLFLTEDGTALSCGAGCNGELGHGNKNRYNTPTEIPNLNNIAQIAMGRFSSLFLTQDGRVLSCGSAWGSKYGYDNHGNYGANRNLTPTEIPNLDKIVQIAAGENHILLLTQDGKVLSCGGGLEWQLGHGNQSEYDIPTEIQNLDNIVQIAAGLYSSFFLTSDGRVFSCGTGYVGQLGHGNRDKIHTPTEVKIPGQPKIVEIAAGDHHTLLLTEDGMVLGCGMLDEGKTTCERLPPRIISDISNVVQISANGHHSLLLTDDGNILSFGCGKDGQLGHGNRRFYPAPTEIPSFDKPIFSEIKIDLQHQDVDMSNVIDSIIDSSNVTDSTIERSQDDSLLSWLFSKSNWFLPWSSSQNNDDAKQSIKRSRDEDSDDLDETEKKAKKF